MTGEQMIHFTIAMVLGGTILAVKVFIFYFIAKTLYRVYRFLHE